MSCNQSQVSGMLENLDGATGEINAGQHTSAMMVLCRRRAIG